MFFFFLVLLYFHMLHAFLSNLSFSSRFLPFPSLTPPTPHLFIYLSLFLAFDSPSSAAYPLASPPFAMSLPFSHDRTGESNDWLLCFHLLSELALWKESLYLRGLHRLGRYVLCCSYRKKDLVWLEFFWGPMGKCELVWVVTPSLTSPKQHAASLEKGRNKPSTVDS